MPCTTTWTLPATNGMLNGQGGNYNLSADTANHQYVARPPAGVHVAYADRVAFTGNTYHPVEDSLGRQGFRSRLNSVIDTLRDRRPEIDSTIDRIRQALNRVWNEDQPTNINTNIIEPVARRLSLFRGATLSRVGFFCAADLFTAVRGGRTFR